MDAFGATGSKATLYLRIPMVEFRISVLGNNQGGPYEEGNEHTLAAQRCYRGHRRQRKSLVCGTTGSFDLTVDSTLFGMSACDKTLPAPL